ncbi:hypothetical protein FVA74_01725 [Salinibacterium sp. dk2585]|uniref:acetate--CoA ligase family protein n=1 Tax=unclassified Salinibacterium TaxID=2632331 RepID=UPI0011C24CCD|nr:MULTISPECIES: acetate--CoA ligase family protein [unclassified Salinibacterium]QEE60429.1 hypothetical protein FVA74_01725 [Salinibacterium sp. dk2585]TXK55502.1 hypothetical protein FVP63_01870 [Salinibacterium sp. dk5596]
MSITNPPTRPSGLDALFAPRSVAVIGASASPEKPSHMPLRNLLRNGFAGEVFPVNPSAESVLGVPAYASITDVPAPVDLAYIVIPAEFVLDELERCAAAGIPCAVVAVSGFAETDSADGRSRQQRIAEIAASSGMRILGPNTNGLYSTPASMSLGYNSAHERTFTRGRLAIISHSGALFSAVAGQLEQREVGLDTFVSVGNEADVTMLDLVEYCVHQGESSVIAMIMESVRDGHRLRGLADDARARGKTLVALKLGRSVAGARATVAHSSRLAGSSAAYEAWLEDAGVPLLDSLESIAGLASIAEHSPAAVRRGGLGVVTYSGGGSALVVDRASELSLPVAELGAETLAALAARLTRPAPLMNPLDMGAGIPLAESYEALSAVANDPGVGAMVVFLHGMQTPAVNLMIARAIAKSQRDTGVLHVVIAPGGVSCEEHDILSDAGIEVFTNTALCLSSLKPLVQVATYEVTTERAVQAETETLPEGVLDERRSLELLARWGIPAVVPRLVRSAIDAHAVADAMGYPVVMKGLVDGVAHKAEAGLVRLGLESPSDVVTNFTSLEAVIAQLSPSGGDIIIERQATGEFEAFVGSSRQPGIGHVLVAGLGGVYTEAIAQVVLWSVPVARDRIRHKLLDSPLGRMLGRLESENPGVTEQFIDVVDRVQDMLLAHRDSVDAIDLNPILITTEGPIAVDALLVASRPGGTPP